MPAAPKEIVYVNGGEIYKAPSNTDLRTNYQPDSEADPIFPFTKADGKRYLFTPEFRAFFGGDGITGTSLEGIDLCPAVDLWICLGAPSPEERTNFDVFFAVNSTAQLREVAQYYGLPYPADDVTSALLDSSPESLLFWNAGGRPIVPGGVKFIDGKPAILKLYTYPKAKGTWGIYMHGFAYHDSGQCFEYGAVYEKETGGQDIDGVHMRGMHSFRKAEVVHSTRIDGVQTRYEYVNSGDPVMFWQGTEIDDAGNVLRVKKFESAQWVQKAIAQMNRGCDLTTRDICPDVPYWVGRAWYEGSTEEELFFAITGGSAMLEAVAAYYRLPVPFNEHQKHVLDTQPELYRARHYDLLGRGLGEYVNVVVGSVVFVNQKPERLLLYTFLRPWEFDEEIQAPELETGAWNQSMV